ncbi:MAG: hypothetical protein KTR32_15305 [Granulosicoccus sp.]|nr:hypothetical protein [Granulosicoccus sp.]
MIDSDLNQQRSWRTRVMELWRNNMFRSSRAARRRRYQQMLKAGTASERFTEIYQHNLWNDQESVSGSGSSLDTTRTVRAKLPELIRQHQIKHFLDAPCGDFNWMRSVMSQLPDVRYTGGDIVTELIEQNQQQEIASNISFVSLDICRDSLPSADLMMVRDCLFHLSYDDIFAFFHNLSNSDIPLLLTSSHHIENQKIQNRDIVSGDFRPIDLFAEPFCFPTDALHQFDDSDELTIGKRMYLFRVPELISYLNQHSKTFVQSGALTSHGAQKERSRKP